MALTLNGGINATTREIVVSGTVPDSIVAGYLFALDDEVLEFQTFYQRWPLPVDKQRWRVRRGVGTSVAASHSNGVSILGARDAWTSGDDEDQPDPFPAGGASSADAVTVSPAVAGESDVQGALEALAAGKVSSSVGFVKLRKITVAFDDFTLDEDRSVFTAPVYTLAEGDWVYLAQILVAEAFDDSAATLAGTQVALYADVVGAGSPLSVYIGGSLALPEDWGPLVQGDRAGVPNLYQNDSGYLLPFTPLPGGGAVPLHLRVDDFAGDGETGQLQVLLWVAEF